MYQDKRAHPNYLTKAMKQANLDCTEEETHEEQ